MYIFLGIFKDVFEFIGWGGMSCRADLADWVTPDPWPWTVEVTQKVWEIRVCTIQKSLGDQTVRTCSYPSIWCSLLHVVLLLCYNGQHYIWCQCVLYDTYVWKRCIWAFVWFSGFLTENVKICHDGSAVCGSHMPCQFHGAGSTCTCHIVCMRGRMSCAGFISFMADWFGYPDICIWSINVLCDIWKCGILCNFGVLTPRHVSRAPGTMHVCNHAWSAIVSLLRVGDASRLVMQACMEKMVCAFKYSDLVNCDWNFLSRWPTCLNKSGC